MQGEKKNMLITQSVLDFVIYVIHSIAEKKCKSPAFVYGRLKQAGAIEGYLVPCYDVLHTLGSEYLAADVSEFAKIRGVAI